MTYSEFMLDRLIPTVLGLASAIVLAVIIYDVLSKSSLAKDKEAARIVLEICLDSGKLSPEKCVEQYKKGVCQ